MAAKWHGPVRLSTIAGSISLERGEIDKFA